MRIPQVRSFPSEHYLAMIRSAPKTGGISETTASDNDNEMNQYHRPDQNGQKFYKGFASMIISGFNSPSRANKKVLTILSRFSYVVFSYAAFTAYGRSNKIQIVIFEQP